MYPIDRMVAWASSALVASTVSRISFPVAASMASNMNVGMMYLDQ
jgi:hypothetical protein